MRNLGLNKADLEVRQSGSGAYPSMSGRGGRDTDDEAGDDDDSDVDDEEEIRRWKLLHDD